MTETSETFTDRKVEVKRIKSLSNGVSFHDAWGFWLPDEVVAKLVVDDVEYLVETKGFNEVGGIATMIWAEWDGVGSIWDTKTGNLKIPVVVEWLYRNSDQDIQRRRDEALEKIARDRAESLERNREAWQARQDALSKPLRLRLERFHLNGGEKFALNGWAYELVVCELTELYYLSDGEDTDAVNAYAEKHGTSGNQHEVARALANLLKEKPEDIGKTISAMTPITGDPDWKK